MIVTFSRLGRMGRLTNGMWQIAGTIGIARKNGFDFGFPYWMNHDGLNFESGIDIDVQKHFVNPLPLFDGKILNEQFIQWGHHDVALNRNTDLIGHFQSEKYFSHCIDEVRHYFTMKDEPPPNDYCALHIRLGDYGGDYHPRLGLDYYLPAIQQFPADQEFLIFSDDISAAKEVFDAMREGPAFNRVTRFHYSEGRDYIEDFKLMKTCKHFIIGNSSYSAMAAVLGESPDKRVVAPRPWFGPAAGITGEDIYGSGWTVIDYQQARIAA